MRSSFLCVSRCLLIVVVLWIIPSRAGAQSLRLKFDRLSVENGLSQSTVTSIVQDSLGFLWIGTQDGLNKYDGYDIKVFRHDPLDSTSLGGNWIQGLYLDLSGTLWVILGVGGLDRYDPGTDRFKHYSHAPITSICDDGSGSLWVTAPGSGISRLIRNPADHVRDFFVHYRPDDEAIHGLDSDLVFSIDRGRDGTVWVATSEGGLHKWNRGSDTFTRFPFPGESVPRRLTAMRTDRNGIPWVGTLSAGLARFDPETRKLVPFRNGSKLSPTHDGFVSSIFEDRHGALWISGRSNELVRIGPDRQSVQTVDLPTGNVPHLLFEDSRARLWAGTGNGLFLMNNQRDGFSAFGQQAGESGPGSITITVMFEDHAGLFWVGTAGGGVSKINEKSLRFRHYGNKLLNVSRPSGNSVTAILEDSASGLWLGTAEGLVHVDRQNKNVTEYKHDPMNPASLNHNVVLALAPGRDRSLWIGTANGFARLDMKTRRFKRYSFAPHVPPGGFGNQVSSICPDAAGKVWIGTPAGFYCLDPKSGNLKRFPTDPETPGALPSSLVWTVKEDRAGNLWVGTARGGLSLLDSSSGRFTNFVYDPGDPGSLNNKTVTEIYEDTKGRLWIGTYSGGLNVFDRTTQTFTGFTVKDGLAGNNVAGILEDSHGNLWLSTNHGISKFDPVKRTFRNFDVSDGLQSNEFNRGARFRNKDGIMFFGGINGFNCFNPDSISDNPHIPSIVITAFRIFDRDVALNRSTHEPEEITLNHDENFFSFEFVALDYTNSENNQYAYKLEGFDRDWIYCGSRRYASYTNLDGGDYTFRVRGSNNDGVWNQKGALLRLRIEPPFWKTFWFFALCTAFGLAVVGIIYRVRLQYEKRKIHEIEQVKAREQIRRFREVENAKTDEREKVRKRIAADFHDESGHKLTKISLFSGVVESKLKSDPNASSEVIDYLDRIIDVSRSLHNDISDFFWALDPDEDTLHDAAIKLKDFGESLFERSGIAFRVNGITGDMESCVLSMAWRRNLTRIFKEGMNNVLKHTSEECQNVTLDFSSRSGDLLVTLSDDGHGFDTGNGSQGRGIKNMYNRAKKLGAILNVESESGKGTRLRFSARLPHQGIDSNA